MRVLAPNRRNEATRLNVWEQTSHHYGGCVGDHRTQERYGHLESATPADANPSERFENHLLDPNLRLLKVKRTQNRRFRDDAT